MAKILAGKVATVEPVKVRLLIEDGDHPDFAPDMTAIHIPGHCNGQLAFHWARHGGVLFPADAFANRGGLKLPVATEDPQLALDSIAKLGVFQFDKVCVMHGKPIMSGGGAQFRATNFDTFKKRKACTMACISTALVVVGSVAGMNTAIALGQAVTLIRERTGIDLPLKS